MSEVPLLSLSDIRVRFGERVLFENLFMNLYPRQRACLIGRNGCGKSTLLKVAADVMSMDDGKCFVKPGTIISYLPQDILIRGTGMTAQDFMLDEAPRPLPQHEIDAALDQVRIPSLREIDTFSGGEMRRLGIARALAYTPDVLLLDEPTNHLDIAAIEWLEETLSQFRGALLVISHDRYFLKAMTTHMLWLDRGMMRSSAKGFAHFETWSETVWADEERQQQRLNKKLTQETDWLHRGVTARRKRNQGRLSRLMELREHKRMYLRAPGLAMFTKVQTESESRLILEAHHLSKKLSSDPKAPPLIHDFSIRLLKGERLGIIGPNGVGKTTLLRLLLGQLKPDEGKVSLKSHVKIAYADQQRLGLEKAKSLWDALCGDGGDHLEVQGRSMHVATYLKSFLFEEKQFRSPISSLSGGEKNRLLLAKILLQPCDLLVLDEPTNDLDVDTLDVLADLLDRYEGTLIMVSHDRDFLDRVATSIIAMEGHGQAQEYAGGYSDYLAQRAGGENESGASSATARPGRTTGRPAPKGSTSGRKPAPQPTLTKMDQHEPLRVPGRLSYKLEHELKVVAEKIDQLSDQRKLLEQQISDPDLFRIDPDQYNAISLDLVTLQKELVVLEERWLSLSLLKENS